MGGLLPVGGEGFKEEGKARCSLWCLQPSVHPASSGPGLLNLTHPHSGPAHSFPREDVMCCRLFSHISGVYALDAGSILPPGVTAKNISRYFRMFQGRVAGGQNPLVGSHCARPPLQIQTQRRSCLLTSRTYVVLLDPLMGRRTRGEKGVGQSVGSQPPVGSVGHRSLRVKGASGLLQTISHFTEEEGGAMWPSPTVNDDR